LGAMPAARFVAAASVEQWDGMPTYQFAFYEFQDFTFTGGAGSTSQTVGLSSGTFRLSPSGAPIEIVVDDNEALFHDGFVDPNVNGPPSTANNDQRLLAPITVNGVTYPTGSQIELEFAVSTNSTQGSQIVFYYVRINGVNVGITGAAQDVVPGVTYTITGSQDGNGDITGTFPLGVPATVPWDTLICFTHGTLIDTPLGPRLIEELEPGDLVTTLGNGSQPLRWVGTRLVTQAEMLARPDLRPVRFEVGTLGNSRPLLVSPQHRMLLSDWRAEVYFGEDNVLVAAKALVNGTTIRQVVPDDGVVYCHLLFDRHEVIIAEGALSESFHPGEIGLGALDEAQRREIEALFPTLMLEERRAAFPIVRNSDARALRLPS
jgi:Hint domain